MSHGESFDHLEPPAWYSRECADCLQDQQVVSVPSAPWKLYKALSTARNAFDSKSSVLELQECISLSTPSRTRPGTELV